MQLFNDSVILRVILEPASGVNNAVRIFPRTITDCVILTSWANCFV